MPWAVYSPRVPGNTASTSVFFLEGEHSHTVLDVGQDDDAAEVRCRRGTHAVLMKRLGCSGGRTHHTPWHNHIRMQDSGSPDRFQLGSRRMELEGEADPPGNATSHMKTNGPSNGMNSAARRQRRRPSTVSSRFAGKSAIITPRAVTPTSRAAGGIAPARGTGAPTPNLSRSSQSWVHYAWNNRPSQYVVARPWTREREWR